MRNAFISALDPRDLSDLRPWLTEGTFVKGASIYEVGDRVSQVILPTSAVISVVTLLSTGEGVESEAVGSEGIAGLVEALSQVPATQRAFVQVSGSALKLPAEQLKRQMMRSSGTLDVVLRHLNSGRSQARQTAACNAVHPVKARLLRWLLLIADRIGTEEVRLSQEDLALMLGVQRTTITAVALELKADGLIDYRRGRIMLLDRERLEEEACECYQISRAGQPVVSSQAQDCRSSLRRG